MCQQLFLQPKLLLLKFQKELQESFCLQTIDPWQ